MTETNSTGLPSVSLQNEQGDKSVKFKYKPRYICKSKVKQLALLTAKGQLSEARQKMFTRVGTSFYEACDAFLANFIASRVKSHPSKGKTLT